MEDFEIGEGEVVDIELTEFGKVMAPVNDKIALIDADTLAWTSALAAQQEHSVMPMEFYSEMEWDAIITNATYDEESMTYKLIDLELALQYADEKLKRIYELTGCRVCELHFSGGRENFRYLIFPNYKANRKGMAIPDGLGDLKVALCQKYTGFIHTKWEADDFVVYRRKYYPDDYLLCAVDKDVLNSIEGKHFNYYESGVFNKDMKFVETSEGTAKVWPYLQCIMGDSSDGIEGVKGLGPKKAALFVNEEMDEEELWEGVLKAYRSKNMDESTAMLNMRLVNMHQLFSADGEIEIALWGPKDV
jgi:DNA polymerase-1